MAAVAEAHHLAALPRSILAALPVPIYTTDADGYLTFYNEAAAQFWGRAPQYGKDKWSGAYRLYQLDGTRIALEDCPMAQALKSGKPQNGMDLIMEREDGTRLFYSPYPTPLFDAAGRLIGGVNLLVDTTESRRLELSLARFRAIVESSDDAIISKNLDGIIQSWNKGAERLFGHTADEAIGRSIVMLIPPDRHNEEPEIIERIRRGERVDHYETLRQRKDGTLVDISLTISPVKNKQGEVVGASKIARDISERKRAEEGKDLLLHEIKHRVKNTLGTVQAIASQTFRTAPREERDAFGARLRAMAEAHDLLTNQDWGDVEVGDVVARAINTFNPSRFDISGDGTALGSAKALLLAMTVHELATNAVKYGALSNVEGRVEIGWHSKDHRLFFTWRETGGPPVAAPRRAGFGTSLIQRAVTGEQGAAQLDYESQGLCARLEIQL